MNILNIFILFLGFIAAVAAKKYYIFNYNKLNWHAAFQDCVSRNLQLATINSQEEQDHIEKAIRKANILPAWYWTSGTNYGAAEQYIWMSTGKPYFFTKWASGQPDNTDPGENCMLIRHVMPDEITWNDWICGGKLHYICEDKFDQRIPRKK